MKIAIGFPVVLFVLLLRFFFPETALGFDFEFEFLEKWAQYDKKGNDTVSTITANLALLFLIIGIAYPLAKFIMKGAGASGRDLRDKLSVFLSAHIIFSLFAFLFSLAHAYYAEASSVFLDLSIIAMAGLVIAGCLIRYIQNLGTKQRENLLRAKKKFFWSFLFLVILGHLLAME